MLHDVQTSSGMPAMNTIMVLQTTLLISTNC